MNAHPTESELIDLATGLLGPDDARTTMEHIRACAECERRLQAIVADREALRARPAPVVVDGHIEFKQTAPPRRLWLGLAVAAAVVIVVALGTLRFANHRRIADYWIPVSSETTTLRSPSDSQHNVSRALRSYQEHDAAAAVEELRALKPPANDVAVSSLRDLYLASALVNAGRAPEGLAMLDRLSLDSLPAQWRYEAQWVRYVALRRTGRNPDARAWLEKLVNEPGEIAARSRAELQRRKD